MHRFCYILLVYFLFTGSAYGQYFQQKVDYSLKVTLLDDLKTIKAGGVITYQNNSSYALDTLYFHLWANAFNDDYSAFAEQQLKLQNTEFIFSPEALRGGFDTIQVSPSAGRLVIDKSNPDLGLIILNNPIPQGGSQEIPIDFTLRIPYQFSRLGYNGEYIQLTHWYPKPAVFDVEGWHWFPYLSTGEFYSEFGDYDIEITLPQHLNMVSTGIQIPNQNEADSNTTYHIKAENVIDMAIAMHASYENETKEYSRPDGSSLSLNVFYDPNNKVWRDSAMHYLESAVAYYESAIGSYTYPHITVVMREGRGGGMEYPMLVTVSGQDYKTLDYYINHEVGHQWFYGILAFNEREHPYLDEGLTTFYEHLYTIQKRGIDFHTSNFPPSLTRDLETPILQQGYLWQKRRGFSESPTTDPSKVSMINYGLNAYEKAAYIYRYLYEYLGAEKFNEGIRTFYNKWKLAHPGVSDLVTELEAASGKDCSWVIDLLSQDVTVDFEIESKDGETRIRNNGDLGLPFEVSDDTGNVMWQPLLQAGATRIIKGNATSVNPSFLGLEINGDNNHLSSGNVVFVPFINIDHTRKKEVYFTPLATWNYADGFGLGTALYNSTFPSKKFQYLLAPQIGLSSKDIIGNAWLAYNQYFDRGAFRKIQYKLSGKRYNYFYSDINGYRNSYTRIVPQVSLHFRNEPNSQKYNKVTIRSIYLNEEFADFSGSGDFVIKDNDILISQVRYDYFDFNVLNRRELYLLGEQRSYTGTFGDSENYIKLSGSLKYQVKYQQANSIDLRIFAAGFLKNTQRQSSSYDPSLAAGSIALFSQGFNDYSYEEYFLNRQQGNGPFTNQVSSITGGFKDALGPQYNLGLSNDFAASFHLSADLPMALPFFFKLKPYFDFGYYRSKATLNDPFKGNTLYSGGLKLSYLDGALEIYLPVFSSSAIDNIYDELGENIFQRISFSIDLHRINLWDLIDDLNF